MGIRLWGLDGSLRFHFSLPLDHNNFEVLFTLVSCLEYGKRERLHAVFLTSYVIPGPDDQQVYSPA